jgi:hypothetical protein
LDEETEAEAAAVLLSPAMRYTTSVFFKNSYFYAGLPRTWWARYLLPFGVVELVTEEEASSRNVTPLVGELLLERRSINSNASPLLRAILEDEEEGDAWGVGNNLSF